jgi:hypothetical protein
MHRKGGKDLTIEAAAAADKCGASFVPPPDMMAEGARATGRFTAWFVDQDGVEQWREEFDNVVTTVGKNLALDTYLAGSAYTVTGPYLGLISSTSFTAVAASDTMSSHSGWLEAGNAHNPTYSGSRGTAAWSAASGASKALSASLPFSITASGTVKGAFLVYGSGASATIDNTGGTLYSAGLYTGGDQPVTSGGTLNVTYTTSM